MSNTNRNAHDALVDLFAEDRKLREREERIRRNAQDSATIIVANATIGVTAPSASCDTTSSSDGGCVA